VLTISCPSTSFCVLGDSGGNVVSSTNPTGGVSAWSSPPALVESPTNLNALYGMSCTLSPSALCAAADEAEDVITSANPTGGPSAWTIATPADPVGGDVLWGISCPSASLCVAAGSDTNGPVLFTSTDPTGGAGNWQVVYPTGDMFATLRGVSCPSVSLCVAVDASGNVLTSTNPTGGASAWSVAAADAAPTESLLGVSCASVSLCVAVDGAGKVITSTNPTGGASAWQVANIGATNGLRGVSCTATPSVLCAAVENTDSVFTSTDPTGGAGAWSAASVDSGGQLGSVSCPSSALCIAGDGGGNIVTGSTTTTPTPTPTPIPTPKPTPKGNPPSSPSAPAPIDQIALAKSKVTASHGVTLELKLGAAGQIDVKVNLLARRHGHKVLELIGLVTEHGRKGGNKFVIKLVHSHKLKPGSYQLTIYSVSGKLTSKSHTLKFTVTRQP
jgi:hypothetical protein